MDFCVVCLENNGEILSRIDISSKKWKEINMQHIIEKHLWWWFLRQPINEDHKQWICQECWQELTTFHIFAQRVKKAHKVYRVSMKNRIVQVCNESEATGQLVIPELIWPTTGIEKESNTMMTEKLPTPTRIPKIRDIQTEEINIVHVKKEPNSNITDCIQQEPMLQNDEEILPNLEYSITHINDYPQQSTEQYEQNQMVPDIKSLAEITSLLQQQNSLNRKINMGIAEIKKTIGNQNSAFTNVLSNEITALKSSFQSQFENPKFTRLFPISSEEELYALENIITAENQSEIVSSVKRILGPKGIIKGICHIFSNELIFEYNVNGIYGKKRLMDYEKTMNVLFLATASDDNSSLVEFNVQLRKAIKTAKNRYFKAECLKRKRVNDSNFEIFEEENSQSVQNEPGCSTYN